MTQPLFGVSTSLLLLFSYGVCQYAAEHDRRCDPHDQKQRPVVGILIRHGGGDVGIIGRRCRIVNIGSERRASDDLEIFVVVGDPP